MRYDLKDGDGVRLTYNVRARLLRELSSIYAGLKLSNIGILFFDARGGLHWWFARIPNMPEISGQVAREDIEGICLNVGELGLPPLDHIAARITASIHASIRYFMDTHWHEA